jgi:hypothetical protein
VGPDGGVSNVDPGASSAHAFAQDADPWIRTIDRQRFLTGPAPSCPANGDTLSIPASKPTPGISELWSVVAW